MGISWDATDSAQLLIYIRYKKDLGLHQLVTTKGPKLTFLGKVKQCGTESNLDSSKFESVHIGGDPAMIGKRSRCVTLLKEFVGHAALTFHCIMHHGSLCAKILNFSHIVKLIVVF